MDITLHILGQIIRQTETTPAYQTYGISRDVDFA